MPSLKVAHRLLLGFIVLAVFAAGLSWLTVITSGWQESRIDDLQAAAVEVQHHATGMSLAAEAVQSNARDMLLRYAHPLEGEGLAAGSAARRATEQSSRNAVAEGLSTFERHLTRSRDLASGEGRATTERVGGIEAAFAGYREAVTQFSEIAGEPEAAAFFDQEVRPAYADALAPLLARHQEATRESVAARIEATRAMSRTAKWFGVIGGLLLLAVALGIGIALARYIGGGLDRTVGAARAVAAGRLTSTVLVDSDDEFGDLAEALNDMVSRLSTATVSKTYVENIVQSMADPLIVVDPDVRVAVVNQALLDLLGYEANELTGASVTRIFAHAGRQRGAAIKHDIERGLSGNVDSKFKTKAGQEVSVSLSSALVRAGGEVQGLVIVAKDITEQKRRERELIEAKEEAERMVQLRDAFLANMSHEIRTPLTGILGSAQVLAEVVQGEHRNLAMIIEDAGHRLLDTINSVLEMARIEAGEVQPEMEILDFAQEAEAVASVLRPLAEKKGLTLRVYAPPQGGRVAAQLDRTCLNRILNNLVGNAIKFTKEGAVSIEVSSEGDDAILTVRDSGIGIAKEFIPFLFDDFKQESTGLERSHEGSGLGLAITKKLVDMMGGTISVDSVKGLGSAFTARFERVPVEEAAALLPPPPSQGDGQPSWDDAGTEIPHTFEPPPSPEERPARDLLLIEDNQQNAYMAKFMLEGYSADVATSPEEAIELGRRYQYGVLLVDINLGTDKSGIDLLHDFRELGGYETTPAVAVTAYALPGDKERFLQEGFDDYVSKPYRKETLREAVEQALASAAASEPLADLDEVLGGSFEDATDAPSDEERSVYLPEDSSSEHDLEFVAADLKEPDAEVVDLDTFLPAPSAPEPDVAVKSDPAPLAAPDAFLSPSDLAPTSAFSEEAAGLVERAEHARQSDDSAPRKVGPSPMLLDDDSFHFVDVSAPGKPGDGPRRSPDAPRR